MNMIIALAFNPIPNVSSIIGTQPIGGIGLIRSKIGFTNISTGLYQPIKIPRGIPITAPSR